MGERRNRDNIKPLIEESRKQRPEQSGNSRICLLECKVRIHPGCGLLMLP